jgi:lincosamide and streptogramin A transport system ATP-binding/permease protein
MSLINVSNLTFSYDGSYDDIFTDVSFQIDTDWRLGFCGRNGRGKTTFLKLLMGCYEYRGTITAGVRFEYFPFTVEDKSLNTSKIISNVAPDAAQWQILRELSKLEINEDVLCRPFSTLSNGEQTKVLLAGLFLRENYFLLIDEPTNHLDMTARETVSQYLKGKSGFILVSHDRAFLDDCVDHILSINKANIEIQSGNFSSWYYNKQLQDGF